MLAYAPPRQSATKSPSAFTVVIALHAAGLAALMLIKPDMIAIAPPKPPTQVTSIPLPPPPPDPVQAQPDRPTPPIPNPQPLPTVPEPLVAIPIAGPPAIGTDSILDLGPPVVVASPSGGGSSGTAALVRTEARLKTPPHRLKPDYPASKRRTGEEALLRLRLQIDAAGRVTAVTPLGQFDQVFFDAAERHILRHWRYEPATLGGDAIAADAVISLQFTLKD